MFYLDRGHCLQLVEPRLGSSRATAGGGVRLCCGWYPPYGAGQFDSKSSPTLRTTVVWRRLTVGVTDSPHKSNDLLFQESLPSAHPARPRRLEGQGGREDNTCALISSFLPLTAALLFVFIKLKPSFLDNELSETSTTLASFADDGGILERK